MRCPFLLAANPKADESAHGPDLAVLQPDLVSGPHSSVVARLIPRERMPGAGRRNPIVSMECRDFWQAMHELLRSIAACCEPRWRI